MSKNLNFKKMDSNGVAAAAATFGTSAGKLLATIYDSIMDGDNFDLKDHTVIFTNDGRMFLVNIFNEAIAVKFKKDAIPAMKDAASRYEYVSFWDGSKSSSKKEEEEDEEEDFSANFSSVNLFNQNAPDLSTSSSEFSSYLKSMGESYNANTDQFEKWLREMAYNGFDEKAIIDMHKQQFKDDVITHVNTIAKVMIYSMVNSHDISERKLSKSRVKATARQAAIAAKTLNVVKNQRLKNNIANAVTFSELKSAYSFMIPALLRKAKPTPKIIVPISIWKELNIMPLPNYFHASGLGMFIAMRKPGWFFAYRVYSLVCSTKFIDLRNYKDSKSKKLAVIEQIKRTNEIMDLIETKAMDGGSELYAVDQNDIAPVDSFIDVVPGLSQILSRPQDGGYQLGTMTFGFASIVKIFINAESYHEIMKDEEKLEFPALSDQISGDRGTLKAYKV